MKDDDKRLLDALRASLQGNLKAAAMSIYSTSEQDAGSRMSKWWTGALNPPAAAYVLGLRGPNPGPLLDVLADLAGAEWTPRTRDAAELRAEALEALANVSEQLEHIADELRDADTAELRGERRGPHKVAPRSRRESA